MQDKQRCIYSARIRQGWFMEARRLGSVAKACRSLGIPRSTYYYWYKRWNKEHRALKSLIDIPKTPKSHKKGPNENLVSLIIQLRLGLMYCEEKLSFILERDYNIKISKHGIHNILSRAGLLEKRKKKTRMSRRLDSYPYKPGEVMQLDVKHWKHSGYQYDIIDCYTRIKFKYIFEDYNVNTTVKFLEMALRFFRPAFNIELVQTDNGAEFTNNQARLDSSRIPPLALPERWLISHGIGFRHIPSASPHLNGRIERPHGVDKWRYRMIVKENYEFSKLAEFAIEDCLDYNTYRLHSMLHNMTPVEFLQRLKGYENTCSDFSVLY